VHGQILKVGEDLRGQFAGGRQHERPRGAARLVDQPVQDRQQKRGGLAAAGLGAGQDVLAVERRRNRIGLNRRRPGEPEVFDGAKKVGVQVQSAESQNVVL
jgi:hypothetical protein